MYNSQTLVTLCDTVNTTIQS